MLDEEDRYKSSRDNTDSETMDFANDPWAESRESRAEGAADPYGMEKDPYIQRIVEPAPEKEPVKPMSFFRKVSLLFVSAVFFGAVAGGIFIGVKELGEHFFDKKNAGTYLGTSDQENVNRKQSYVLNQADSIQLPEQSGNVSVEDVSAVVKNVMPSVVAINCYAYQSYGGFFGGMTEPSLTLAGSGSGIIIGQNDTEILIVTNNHVIEGAEQIKIEFVDGRSAEAVVKGTEPSSDLAVVSVAFANLEEETINSVCIARLGDSDAVEIGQMAIAIGNALGYGQSVTVGYISAKDRQVTVDKVVYTLIQTDAAINPGNSGGALLNTRGEVIGINSVKYSDSSVEGMGFAIPISNIVELIEDLSNREQLTREESGFLGIEGSMDISSEYSSLLGISQGVYVRGVVKDSPAQKAGIYVGDVITKIENTTVNNMSDLQNFLSYTRAGSTVTITVQRLLEGEYRPIELQVTLGAIPEEYQ